MKRFWASLLLALTLLLSLVPTAWAEGGVTTVATDTDLTKALADSTVTEIQVAGDIVYTYDVSTDKKIVVTSGHKLTTKGYSRNFSANPLMIENDAEFVAFASDIGAKVTISGNIVNDGSISVTGNYCYWRATTSGTGSFTATEKTYVDYGCVPAEMLGDSNYKINITADPIVPSAVTLPDNMQTGQQISPIVSGLIEGVPIAEAFTFTWRNASSAAIYDGAASPVLTDAGTLKLSLSPKSPYVMRSSTGTYGTLSTQGEVTQAAMDTVYVDYTQSNDNGSGNESSPVKSIRTALDKVSDGGTIVLLSDYTGGDVILKKAVTITSTEGHRYTLSPNNVTIPIYLYDNVAPILDTVDLTNAKFARDSSGAGTLTLSNCTGSDVSISNGVLKDLTVTDSQLAGTFYASGKLTLNSSTISGRFVTHDFDATGDCAFVQTSKNTSAKITDNITTTPVKVTPAAVERGVQVIQLGASNHSDAVTHFVFTSNQAGYALKCRNISNSYYLVVSQALSAADGKLSVFYAPVIGGPVMDSLKGDTSPRYTDIQLTNTMTNHVESAVWSGHAAANIWSLDDVPVLTVTLKSNEDVYFHFDDTFDASQLKVYSSNKEPTLDRYAEEMLRTDLTIGSCTVSDDGRTLTFTVTSPAVARLPQSIGMDTTPRAAHCGDSLAARQATAKTTLSYLSSDPAIASVDLVTGQITVHKAGEVTITVTAAETDLYATATASYTLTVSHQFGADWKSDAHDHWQLCTCGEKGSLAPHKGGKATCTTKAKCDVSAARHTALWLLIPTAAA